MLYKVRDEGGKDLAECRAWVKQVVISGVS